MAATRISIPTLTGGVSRQPQQTRFPNQFEEATNVTLDQVRGLEKRAGSLFEFISVDNHNSSTVFGWIERSSTEQYMIVITRADTGNYIRIFNVVSGQEATVSYESGTQSEIQTYLNTTGGEIRMTTVADTTFVWNTAVATALSGNATTYTPVLLKYNNASGDPVSIVDYGDFPKPPGSSIPPSATFDGTPGNPYHVRALRSFPGFPPGYYLSNNAGQGEPDYIRKPAPAANGQLTQTKMPFKIFNNGLNSFTVGWNTWNQRMSGDEDTNPGPSFASKGLPITDMVFFRNRLWVGSGEFVCSSQSGDLFNFFADDPTNLVESDPIDVTIGTNRFAPVQHLTPFQRALVVHTKGDQQFEIRSNQGISPVDVQILPSTNYEPATSDPITTGSLLYFTTERSGSAQLYEYRYVDDATVSSADDVAAHAYGFVKKGVNQSAHSEASGQMFLHSPEEPKCLYVYNYMLIGDQGKAQSAWSKWEFPHDIKGFHVLDQILYIVRDDESGSLAVDSLRLLTPVLAENDDNMDYPVRLDSRKTITGSFDSATNSTSWATTDATHDTLVLGPEWGSRAGVFKTPIREGSSLKLSGDWSTHPMIVGTTFNMSVTLSELFMRDNQGAPVSGTLQLKNMTVYHRDTSFYQVVVEASGRPSREMAYTAKTVGALDLLLNRNVLSSPVKQHFPIMASSGGVKIKLESNNPAPVNLTGVEFTASFVGGKRAITED